MKVYLTEQAGLSRAMARVSMSLVTHAPEMVQVVMDRSQADLVVLHVIGHPETFEAVEQLKKEGRKYAIIQYCLRTTQKPRTQDWAFNIWSGAEVVWSYYDLRQACREDGIVNPEMPNFYHAPLGVDPIFNGVDTFRDVLAMTSGYVSGPHAEAIEEVARAAERRNGHVLHIGPKPEGLSAPLNGHFHTAFNISDFVLAEVYHRAEWVSGLRHGEGFEMPALEGLVCGARPVVFDRPEMRQWYDGHAEFIPECHGEELIERLLEVFATPRPVPIHERQAIRKRFAWGDIAGGFWERVVS